MLHYGCMKNINKTIKYSLTLGLGILAILAIGTVVVPKDASAYTSSGEGGYNYNYNDINNFDNNYNNYQTQSYYNTRTVYVPTPTPVYVNPATVPVYVNPSVTPVVYSSTTNTNTTAPKTIVKAKTNNSTAVAKATTDENSKLAANVIFGSGSFMPSGLVQWILFAILVLLAVILIRKIYGGNERYNAVPLKHK